MALCREREAPCTKHARGAMRKRAPVTPSPGGAKAAQGIGGRGTSLTADETAGGAERVMGAPGATGQEIHRGRRTRVCREDGGKQRERAHELGVEGVEVGGRDDSQPAGLRHFDEGRGAHVVQEAAPHEHLPVRVDSQAKAARLHVRAGLRDIHPSRKSGGFLVGEEQVTGVAGPQARRRTGAPRRRPHSP